MLKSFPAIVGNGILSSVCKSTIHEVAAYEGACTTLSCIAMHKYDITRIFHKELEHLLAASCEEVKSWTVMIFPFKRGYLSIKGCWIIPNSCEVEYPIVVTVRFLDVLGYIADIISVELLDCTSSWKGHSDYPGCDVCQV